VSTPKAPGKATGKRAIVELESESESDVESKTNQVHEQHQPVDIARAVPTLGLQHLLAKSKVDEKRRQSLMII
jgi:hypothetical protein